MTDSLAGRFARYQGLTGELSAPVGILDLDALEHNAADMLRRAAGTPIRLSTKSLRCLPLIQHLLRMPGIHGALALTLSEALWLHAHGVEDIVVGYPTVDRAALARLGAAAEDELPVVLMVDSVAQVDLAQSLTGASRQRPLRVCLELDAGLRVGSRVHLGPRRSPIHTPGQLVALAETLARRPEVRIEGVMAYEGQIAGVADAGGGPRARAVRAMKTVSRRELAERRAAAIEAVSRVARLRFVNGGGSGSIDSTGAEACVTEIAAGSGFVGPALFDRYVDMAPRPAMLFGLDVVRRPVPGIATLLGGGWVASGPPGADRMPAIAWPEGLSFTSMEGPGETQSPVTGPAADRLRIGDRVWLRHAKAGELCERLNELQVISGDRLSGAWSTYRGAGKAYL
ncbi:alanine racemase [Blastococcus sp. Marseille-P5729]|uniref:alanine racemase n=1 Tax=Blastococcus sp. Marseille-P5729 TaxID=2086582 RepID=UPI000D0ECD2F|nr:alanine racemase [Blastococcus sp. Marseille-P5729]